MRAIQTTGAGSSAAFAFTRDQLAGLPAPVVRYFDFALPPGQPLVRRAHIRQRGTFAMRPGRWSPFTATEHFTVRPPTFVWDARIRVAPLLAVHVRDSYIVGEGATTGKLAGLIPVVDLRGTPEMASGALVRYLAEAAWFPTALLPSEGVSWSAVNDRTARATLTDGATAVSLDVHFGERGEIVRASAMRHRAVQRGTVLTPWVCHYRDYARTDGMMIPMAAEVEWVLPEKRFPYWRGSALGVEYELAPQMP